MMQRTVLIIALPHHIMAYQFLVLEEEVPSDKGGGAIRVSGWSSTLLASSEVTTDKVEEDHIVAVASSTHLQHV